MEPSRKYGRTENKFRTNQIGSDCSIEQSHDLKFWLCNCYLNFYRLTLLPCSYFIYEMEVISPPIIP